MVEPDHSSMHATSALEPARGGDPLACTVSGVGERIVLVHGFTQTGASWRHVARLLEERFEVVTVDLPGHGGSSSIRVQGLEETAERIGEVAGRATYVGYSLGGRCCLTLALALPHLVERLVLVGATAGIEDGGERAARRAADEALAEQIDPSTSDAERIELADFLDQWLAGPLFSHLDAEQADLGSRLANTSAGLASSLRSVGTGTQEPSWDRLGGLTMPVVLVTGGRDAKFAQLAARMATAIGDNASHEVVPGVGHAVPFEAPARFSTIVAGARSTGPAGHSSATSG